MQILDSITILKFGDEVIPERAIWGDRSNELDKKCALTMFTIVCENEPALVVDIYQAMLIASCIAVITFQAGAVQN